MIKKILIGAVLFVNGSMFADVFYNDCCYQSDDCNNCFNWAVWFDPMAVKPCQMPLEFAESEINNTTDEESIINFEDHFLHPQWSFGFRVGAGLRPQCSPWSFRADYTHWYNKTSSSTTLNGTDTIVRPGEPETNLTPKIADSFGFTIFLPASTDVGTVATTLKYHYNLLDVTTGWSCCVCNGLELTPYGGFRGFWYSTNVTEVSSDSTGVTFSPTGDPSTASNDYNAYGIVGGLRFNYNLWRCFNFYGSFGGSIIGGNNHNKINFLANGGGGSFLEIRTTDETMCLFIHSLEGAWGVTYDTCICGYNTHIGLGYEVTQWSEVLPHPFRQNSTSPGDATKTSNGLFVQAITARLGVGF